MSHTGEAKKTPLLAAISSLLGTCLEWYDFYIYGTASAIVFSKVFFPSFSPLVGTLLAFGTFSVGAVMRPLGGVICGHFGDTIGRKAMLVWTLVLMGACTMAIGLLPSYERIGVLAPLALVVLRSIQGFAFGGEWAGAVLMSVEHAPAKRSGFYGSIAQMGSPIALFLSTGTFALLGHLPQAALLSWGWRIPFVGSGILILIGLFFRLKLLESPSFIKALERREILTSPIFHVLRHNLAAVLMGAGVVLCTAVAFYVQAVFVISYVTQTVGTSRSTALNAVLVGSFFEIIFLPAFAVVADRIGIRQVAAFGALWTAIFAFPFFTFVRSASLFDVSAGIVLAMVGISALFAVLPAYVSGLFDINVRYTGISLAYGIGAGLFGGFTPLIASSLFVWAKSTWPISLYLVIVGLVSFAAVIFRPKGVRSDQATRVVRVGLDSRL
ncbi:MFS transporter [Paraburkholderia caledonica]|uniref:MHS family shikimate/dehydroshikimate transporter-like MFS transporter n=1 Tax=Paraburkholderia caledonica TaxID=134536 RepID=A0ABU1KYW0_9BURK|nr:MFS transporter [Paraburkholderia caledonica]MDR6376127.1 MHS family shikimate/dehydroshikimate transporter-like MFS transporter [Paraburkholderia caledonica]